MDKAEIDLEQLFKSILASQQPFFTAQLNQLAGMQSQILKQHDDLMQVRDSVHLLVNQELNTRLKIISNRLDVLEQERHERKGVLNATVWVPKTLQWVAIAAFALFTYWEQVIKAGGK